MLLKIVPLADEKEVVIPNIGDDSDREKQYASRTI
jgi:hypothetical protein